MADGLKLKIDTSAFQKRVRTYTRALNSTLKTEWPAIAAQMAADVATRTPRKETEYDFIMTGANPTVKLVPLAGDVSDDNDGTPRIRFMRNPGAWLEQLVLEPGIGYTFDPGNLRIDMGHRAILDEWSRYSWQDSSRTGTHYYESPSGVFELFEFGAHNTVRIRGSNYKLSPDDSTHYLDEPEFMDKYYPRFAMYSGFHSSTFFEAVSARIRDVKF